MSVNLRDQRSKRNCPRLDPGPGPEPRPARHPLVARVSGNCCRTPSAFTAPVGLDEAAVSENDIWIILWVRVKQPLDWFVYITI